MSGRRTARRVLPLAALFVVALSGCQARGEMLVDLDRHGLGLVEATVRLDAAAATQLGDPATQLRTADLTAAGWIVLAPTRTPDGGVELRARKEVDGPRQAQAALRSLLAPDVLADLRVSRRASPWRDDLRLEGRVDLRRGLGAFGDAKVAEVLGTTSPLTAGPAEQARLLGGPVDEVVQLELVSRLAGSTTRVALPLGQTTPVMARAAAWRLPVLAGAGAAGSAALGLAILAVLARRGRRHPRGGRPGAAGPAGAP